MEEIHQEKNVVVEILIVSHYKVTCYMIKGGGSCFK